MNGLIGCIVLAGLAGTASAGYVGDVILRDSWGDGSGGEFRAIKQSNWTLPDVRATGTKFQGGILPAANLFETFCLEAHEVVSLGTVYKADIQAYAQANSTNTNYFTGTGGHGGTIDYISEQTAYLYWKFITKSLSNYDYTDTGTNTERKDDARQLQLAFWFFEEEIASIAGSNTEALAWVAEANTAVNVLGWRGAGTRVFVMNLYTNTVRTDWQSQLIAIPLPNGQGMATAGLVALAWFRRRR